MYMMKIGINYATTPIEIRERLSFSEHKINMAMRQLANVEHIIENVILSTCNRTEIYVIVDELQEGKEASIEFLADWFELNSLKIAPYLEICLGEEMIKHLYNVISGLDSMVLGETQILGQVRDAFLTAQANKTTGRVFNELFKRAITFAKRAHAKTAIGAQAVSVSYAAVELANQSFAKIYDQTVTIIGAGEMSELALKNVLSLGVQDVTIVSRTFETAKNLANRYHVQAGKLDNLLVILEKTNIVFSSTSATKPILTKKDIEKFINKRNSPLFIVDIGVPRDIDPAIKEIKNITLYNIDDLQAVIDRNLVKRKQAAKKIKHMLVEEIESFKDWLVLSSAVPVISDLHQKGRAIQETVLTSIFQKIPTLTAREKRVLVKHTGSIINQLLSQPINEAKVISRTKNASEVLDCFVDIAGLDPSVKQQSAQRMKQYETLLTTDAEIDPAYKYINKS